MNQLVSLSRPSPAELPVGTRLLNGQYLILDHLQQGGFGITYVARDSLERHVVIKECFPAGICERADGCVRAVSPMVEEQFSALKQQFVREARGVATLKHPFIVAVHQVFEENNTAYMALDYVEGIDLITVLEETPERITSAFLETTLRQTLKAVWHIHSKGIMHRDIAPDNIRVDDADRITLIDFGAAGARSTEPEMAPTSLPAVKDGYSPPEFYLSGAVQDFSSDFYSLGATYYLLITGEVPPSGDVRQMMISAGEADPYVPLAAGNWDIGNHLLTTIDLALVIDRDSRIQSADQWLIALDETPHKRPAQTMVSAFDPELDAIVSRLVMETNMSLAVDMLAQPAIGATASEKAAADAASGPAPRKWSDILGNPIDDVSDWQKKQEREAHRREASIPQPILQKVLGITSFPARKPERANFSEVRASEHHRKSLIGGLLSRCMTSRPEACPA